MRAEQKGNKIMRCLLKVVSELLPRGVMNSNKYCNKPLRTSKLGSPKHKIAA
jgi:hypothetical protein